MFKLGHQCKYDVTVTVVIIIIVIIPKLAVMLERFEYNSNFFSGPFM